MMYLLLIITSFLLQAVPTSAYSYWDDTEELKPCPNITPDSTVDFHRLGGRWQLSLLVMDAATEDLVENGNCVNGQVTLLNSTHMRQVWEMFTPYIENEPTATFELIALSERPGVWTVQTPLGGSLSATVIQSSPTHILVTHCGWHRGSQVHLWTAGATRGRLQPRDRVKLSKALTKAGFHPSETKIITWSNC